ncbi:MAG: 16S rRNA (cytosine(1402)-N(4))-methyltransferase, partial [Gammaproteobacteria bacterium]|nr:16S rRNA (cytosine(1402)-N(4))-methyltransferase [Gammaproteobacteria bacterium]
MLEELVAAVATDRDGQYVDATYGRGGHARRLLAELSPRARLLVVDRDADAIADARRLAARDSRVSVARGRFGDLADHLAGVEPSAGEREGPAPRRREPSAGEREGPAPRKREPSAGEREGPALGKREPVVPCGVMFDVGVSSPQLDDARRGFSFALDGPLDMRMDQREALTASTWLNRASTAEVEAVIRDYGEERFARRIARRVVAERPLETTAELAAVVRAAMPG